MHKLRLLSNQSESAWQHWRPIEQPEASVAAAMPRGSCVVTSSLESPETIVLQLSFSMLMLVQGKPHSVTMKLSVDFGTGNSSGAPTY